MEPPSGLQFDGDKVCLLLKSIYGIKTVTSTME